MSLSYIRIGVPTVRVGKDTIGITTGGISFKEHWTKHTPATVEIKLKVLGKIWTPDIEIGEKVDLEIRMPCWADGTQEIITCKSAELVKKKQSIKASEPEIWSLKFKCNKHGVFSSDILKGNESIGITVEIKPDCAADFQIQI